MTATLALKPVASVEDVPALAGPDFDWLLSHVQSNRFLPHPPPESIYVGDGDYRAIGAEFLGHFVRLGGLKPHERVLDIGCGIGRMAVPLTQYLDERGSYDGVDPVMEGIMWCARTITPAYPRFRFQRLDIAHPLYNPQGSLPGTEVRFGFVEHSFDFIAMVSVATHLPPDELTVYLAEAARLLSPGGRLFLTAFAIEGQPTGHERLSFRRWGQGPGWYAIEEAPLAAAGIDAAFLREETQKTGLVIESLRRGHWRGVNSAHYQDLLIATQPERAR
jgi:SAM-dependent methyltransferase